MGLQAPNLKNLTGCKHMYVFEGGWCVHVCVWWAVHACSDTCPPLCDPMDGGSPDSSVHGILQARLQEWVAMPFFRGSSWPRH